MVRTGKEKPMNHLIFVYGTLKRGEPLNKHLEHDRFVGEASTQPFYRLLHNGWYPMLVHAKNGLEIGGEVWEVDDETLKMLDRVEGHPFTYKRVKVRLQEPFPETVQAYFHQRSTEGLKDCGTTWPPDVVLAQREIQRIVQGAKS
jgi:gamma-glutamylaminecyclotransferase